MVKSNRYKAAVHSLWDGRATVTVREGVLNEAKRAFQNPPLRMPWASVSGPSTTR